MNNGFLRIFACVATVLCLAQPALAGECDMKEALFNAARQAGVELNREQTVTASSPGVSIAGTSIAGFEQVPATELPAGVRAGFIYLDARESGIPAGFYQLKVQAREPKEGTYEGTVSLISMEGKEVAILPASMETWSMDVPDPLPFEQTRMEIQRHIDLGDKDGVGRRDYVIIIYHCPNGTTFVFIITVSK